MNDDNFGCFLIICGAALFGIISLAYGAKAYSCGSRADMMKLSHSWGPMQGCMVDVGDRYAPIEYVRIIDGKVSIQGDGE